MLDQAFPPDLEQHLSGPRLLVLDDDVATGRMLGRIGTAAGLVATVTTSAPAFQSEYLRAIPDVIILDLCLDDTDGVEQVRYLSAQGYPNALVLISGFDTRVLATVSDVATGFGLNVAATHEKPIMVARLQETLTRIGISGPSFPAGQLVQQLRDSEMMLEYQPVVRTGTRSLGKLQAVTRWQHPHQGRQPPTKFPPSVIQHPDTARAWTEWLIKTASGDYQRLKRAGITVPITVNISPECLTDRHFPERLTHLLGDMPPQQLCLEIIGTAAFHDLGHSSEILTQLRLKGIGLSIGHFGIGYSSLKLLRQIPFTALKIDRSFIADMLTSHDSHAIVKTIVDLTGTMAMESIAEGVESEAIAARLEQMGVDFMQGYSIGRAMPADQLPILLGALYPASTSVAASNDMSIASEATANAIGLSKLTPRQQTVIGLVAAGYSVKQMARHLNLGIGTVKAHLSQAYLALGAHNRIDALRLTGMLPASHLADTDEADAGIVKHA